MLLQTPFLSNMSSINILEALFQCICWFPFVWLVLLQSMCTYMVMSELTGGREKGSKRMSWKYNKFKKINPFKICQHGLCGCGRYSDWNKRLCSVAWDVALKCHIHGLNPPGICWNLHCVLWEKEKNCQWPCSFILCWRKFSDGTSKPFCMIALQFRANTLCLL